MECRYVYLRVVVSAEYLCYYNYVILFYNFIQFIEVTLVNKIMQVSSVQPYNTSYVYCIVHSVPKSSLLPSPFIPPFPFSTSPYPPFPSGNHYIVVCVFLLVCLFIIFFL